MPAGIDEDCAGPLKAYGWLEETTGGRFWPAVETSNSHFGLPALCRLVAICGDQWSLVV